MENSKNATRRLAKAYADRGDPNGWFEEFYAQAEGDIHKVYWADLKPNPLLLDWISGQPNLSGKQAITIGCGLGDDAEALAQTGYQVTAFDISPSAIAMCQQRYPDSPVEEFFTIDDAVEGQLQPFGAQRGIQAGRVELCSALLPDIRLRAEL